MKNFISDIAEKSSSIISEDAIINASQPFSEARIVVSSLELAIQELTPRECEVFLLLTGDEGAKGIAAKLNISKHTLNEHIRGIYRKLSVNNRMACVNLHPARTRIPLPKEM